MTEINKLKEKINNLPSSKAIQFFELYAFIYGKYYKTANTKKPLPTISKYREDAYCKLLGRSMNRKKMEKELEKMIPRTSWSTHICIIEMINDFSKILNQNIGV